MSVWVLAMGDHPFGRVEQLLGTHVETRWVTLFRFPVVPSSSWLLLQAPEGARTVRIPLSLRSVAVTALRVWVLPGGVATLLLWNPYVAAGFGVLAAAGFSASFALARLGTREAAKRLVAVELGARGEDPALTAFENVARRRAIESLLREAAKETAAGYRDVAPTWEAVVLGDRSRDRTFLAAATTLARMEVLDAPEEMRGYWHALEERAFASLVTVDPSVDSRAREEGSHAPESSPWEEQITRRAAEPPKVRARAHDEVQRESPLGHSLSAGRPLTKERAVGLALSAIAVGALGVPVLLSTEGDDYLNSLGVRALLTLTLLGGMLALLGPYLLIVGSGVDPATGVRSPTYTRNTLLLTVGGLLLGLGLFAYFQTK